MKLEDPTSQPQELKGDTNYGGEYKKQHIIINKPHNYPRDSIDGAINSFTRKELVITIKIRVDGIYQTVKVNKDP